MANRVIGLSNIHYAILQGDGSYSTPKKLSGAKTLSTTNSYSEASFYSDNVLDFYTKGLTLMEVELEMAYLLPSDEAALTGKSFDEQTGALVSGADDSPVTIALIYEMATLAEPIRRVIYEVALTKEESSASTKTDEVEEQLVLLKGVAKPREIDNKIDMVLDKNVSSVDTHVWNSMLSNVLLPGFSVNESGNILNGSETINKQ